MLLIFFLLVTTQRQDTVINADGPLVSYIVQAASLDHALRVATDVGGEITHELGIINAVGANLTPSQVEILRQTEGIKVLENNRVKVSSVTDTVRDEFNSTSFSNNDGTATWKTDWIETGENNGPSSGDVTVESDECPHGGKCIELDADDDNDSVERSVDLSGASSATLTYEHNWDGYGRVVQEVSGDGGSTWTVSCR